MNEGFRPSRIVVGLCTALLAASPSVAQTDTVLPDAMLAGVARMEAMGSPMYWLEDHVGVRLDSGALVWVSVDAADPPGGPMLVCGRIYRSDVDADVGCGRGWRFEILHPSEPAAAGVRVEAAGGRVTGISIGGRRAADLEWHSGLLVAIRRSTGGVRNLNYDLDGRLAGETGDGAPQDYEYDAGGRMTVARWNGLAHAVTYDASGRVAAVRMPGGSSYRFGFSEEGGARIAAVREGSGPETRWTFRPGLMESDRGGARFTTRFDGAGRVIRWRDPEGNTIECDRDASGRPLRWRDETGAEWTVRRDAAGRPVEWSHPDGARESAAYDEAGRLASRTDALGRVTRIEYSADGRRMTVRGESAGGQVVMAQEGADRVVVEQPGGARWATELGATVERVTDPVGRVQERRFNAAGDLVEMRVGGAASFVSSYARPGGMPTEFTGVDGVVNRPEYAPGGPQWTAVRRADGDLEFAFREDGLLVRESDRGEAVETTYRHAADGKLDRIERSDGARMTLSYDRAGRMTSVEHEAAGRRMVERFDVAGRLVESREAGGDRTVYRYDVGGRLVAEDSSAYGTLTYRHDAAGRLVGAVSPNTHAAWSYDAQDRLVRSETPGASLALRHRESQVEIADAAGSWRRLQIDAVGRVTGVEDAAGGRVRYRLDARDRVVGVEGPGARVEELAYTPDGGLRRWAVDGREVLAFEFDAAGRPVAARGLQGGMTWRRDAAGRVAEEKDEAGGFVLGRRFDAAGRVVELAPRDAPVLRFAHTEQGQVKEAGCGDLAVRIDYDEFGRPVRRGYPGGVSQATGYDAAGRTAWVEVTDASRRVVYRAAWTHDVEGRAVATEIQGRRTRLDYTADGSVAGHRTGDEARIAYTYDVAGNATSLEGRAIRCGPMNRVTEAGDRRYTWDERGSAISMAGPGQAWTFGYDAAGRLASATREGAVIAYRYDTRGRLVARAAQGTETRLQYDDDRLLVEWRDAKPVVIHVPGNPEDPTVALVSGSRMFCPVFDPNGSLLAVVDDTGRRVWESVYRPFGDREVLCAGFAVAADFHGRYRDPDLGLILMGARWYDPHSGRFLQSDPDPGDASDPLAFNDYLLCRNDPVNFTDSSGLRRNRFLPQERINQIKAQNAQTVVRTTGRVAPMKGQLSLPKLNPPTGGNTQSDFLNGLKKNGPWNNAGPKGSSAEAMANHYGNKPPPARGFDTRQAANASAKIKSALAGRGPAPAPPAPTAPPVPTLGQQALKWGGRGLVIYGVINSGLNIANADNKTDQAINEVGRWTGALGGAKLGGTLGAPFGPIGIGIGGLLGGILGGVVGDAITSPANKPPPLPPMGPADPAVIGKTLTDFKNSGMPFETPTTGVKNDTTDIGGPRPGVSGGVLVNPGAGGDLKGAEPSATSAGAAAVGDTTVAAGGLNTFVGGRDERTDANTKSSFGLMSGQQNVSEATARGDQATADAKNAVNAAGQEAQTTGSKSASATAAGNREGSWGKAIADGVQQGVQQGLTAAGETFGKQAGEKVSGSIFKGGNSGAKDGGTTGGAQGSGSASGSSGSTPGGAQVAGTGGRSSGRKGQKGDKKGQGPPPIPPPAGGTGIAAGDSKTAVVSTTQNPDGTFSVKYACGYGWTGKPPVPQQCPVCKKDLVSTTQTPTTPASPPPTTPPTPTIPPDAAAAADAAPVAPGGMGIPGFTIPGATPPPPAPAPPAGAKP